MTTKEEIKEYLVNEFPNYDVNINGYKNQVLTVHLDSRGREDRPCSDVQKRLFFLPFNKSLMGNNFHMRKAEFNSSRYTFSCFLPKEFVTPINESKLTGFIINLMRENDINSLDDLFDWITPKLQSVSRLAHLEKVYAYKRNLRNIKTNIIRFMYRNNGWDKISHQISYCDDELTLFERGDYSFHLRKATFDNFCKDDDIKFIENVYQKKDYAHITKESLGEDARVLNKINQNMNIFKKLL